MSNLRIPGARGIAVAGAVLLAYAGAGFWGVPALVRHEVPKLAQEQLQRQGSVGEVRFNPFTLRFEADDLRLAEADGSPIFGVGRLAVEMQWRSIVRRAWSFADIRIERPSANLVVWPDGRLNLAALADTLAKQPSEPSKDKGLPRLIIEQFTLDPGRVEMRDLHAGYTNTFTPVSFTLANFSTLPGPNDDYTLNAQSASSGRIRWKGQATFEPIRASGEFVLENASLPDLGAYLKPYTHARIAAGRLSATLPYTFAYDNGKFDVRLAGARIALADFALAREGQSDAFGALSQFEISGINADLIGADVSVAQIRAQGGKLRVRRDAKGELDLANLMVETAGPAAAPKPAPDVPPRDWKLAVQQVSLEQVAVDAIDETLQPPLALGIASANLQLRANAAQTRGAVQVQVVDAALALDKVSVGSGGQTPVKLAKLEVTGGQFDMAAHQVSLAALQAKDGQVQVERDAKGEINLLRLKPGAGAARATPTVAAASASTSPSGKPWTATVGRIALANFAADVHDAGTGVKVRAENIGLQLEGAGTDMKRPVKFDAGFALREGGRFAAKGQLVPANGQVQADVQVKQLALAPLQPLLGRFVRLKLAGGKVDAQGRVATGDGTGKSPALRYTGALDVSGLVLNEEDGDLFASWKSVAAPQLTVALGPQRVDIPELRVVGANAKLMIEDDRSFNAARLLVKAPEAVAPAAPSATPAPATSDDLHIRIRRVRLQDAKLDFTDLSLRPQFAAKIFELNGAINGLSSSRESRSQVELDGRVDDFGLARIRGELNPFALSDNTDLNVVFKNVDMVPTSPYSMKFAGYRIAQGKISLDLNYKIHQRKLEGTNQIVIDQLTLGERVDSPEAIKLPLELAVAILKDSDGRIALGLPVSGDMNDPQFSYGAIVWKAIGNVLTKIVTAPFRALGSLFGVSGDKLEAIDFDAGSPRLLPPEKEKLKQVAQILSKRAQLKLAVPANYSEAADGAALRQRAVRLEVAKRAGLKLEAGEEPGPIDTHDRAVRKALRELYAERFGDRELDKAKQAAEAAPAASSSASASALSSSSPASSTAATAEGVKLPVWQRVTNMVRGEPQVADATAFYAQLQQRLQREQKLAPDALTQLGTQRAQAVVAALQEAGVDAARASAGPPAGVEAAAGKPVPVRLELSAK